MVKVYSSSVDFRVLSNELKFVFFVSGDINNKNHEKTKCCTFTYDTQFPAEIFVRLDGNNKRLFIKHY